MLASGFPNSFIFPQLPGLALSSGLMQMAGEIATTEQQPPPAGGGRDAAKGRMHGGCRQILRRLGCHALGAGLGLVCSEEISQALKQKDMVRTYGQNVSGLRERQAGTEREIGAEKGAGGVTEMHARGHDTGQQREELKRSTGRRGDWVVGIVLCWGKGLLELGERPYGRVEKKVSGLEINILKSL